MASIQLLLVEDNFLVAEDIRFIIEQLGFEVSKIVDNGKEAIQFVIDHEPDLIIMDIRLKGELDGIETATQLAKDHNIPVIYLTDQHDEETYKRAKETKPYAFLSKPFTAPELQRNVELAILHTYQNQKDIDEKDSLEEGKVFHKHYMLKHNKILYSIDLRNILWIEADGSYCKLNTIDNSWHIAKPMKDILSNLHHADYCKKYLIRISRSVTINIEKIDKIEGNKVSIGDQNFSFGDTYRDLLFKHIQTV